MNNNNLILKSRFKAEKITAWRIYDTLLDQYIETVGGQVAYLNKNELNKAITDLIILDWNAKISVHDIYRWTKNRRFKEYLFLKDEIEPKINPHKDRVKEIITSQEIDKLRAIIKYYLKGKSIDIKKGLHQEIKTSLFYRKALIKISIEILE